MKKNDGGPAFPTMNSPGMSLRDWFAGMAMMGMAASPGSLTKDFKGPDIFIAAAQTAYRVADAMLKAREE